MPPPAPLSLQPCFSRVPLLGLYQVDIYLIDKFWCPETDFYKFFLKCQMILVLFVASHLQLKVTNTEKNNPAFHCYF